MPRKFIPFTLCFVARRLSSWSLSPSVFFERLGSGVAAGSFWLRRPKARYNLRRGLNFSSPVSGGIKEHQSSIMSGKNFEADRDSIERLRARPTAAGDESLDRFGAQGVLSRSRYLKQRRRARA
jgi:hypothetical protein